jgi:type II secretory pathway pseudopilin PulG
MSTQYSALSTQYYVRRAFTLLELLLANMLIAILLGGVLLLISSLSREQKKVSQPQESFDSIFPLLRHDLSNSESIRLLPNQSGFILTGHASLDAKSLTPTDRRTRVIYEIRRRGSILCLIREQSYLDDPVKPQRFEELLATNITSLSLSAPGATPADDDELNLDEADAFALPSSVTVHLGAQHRATNQQFLLR